MLPDVPGFQRAVLVAALGLALAACRSDAETRKKERAARSRAVEAHVAAVVEARLRELFPEVEGEISRDAIARAVAAGVAGDSRRGSGDVRAATLAAVESDDYERARALLGELIAADHVARAQEAALRDDVRGALAALDLAVEIAPHTPAILVQRAQAALAVGSEDREPALVQSALDGFVAAAGIIPSAQAWLGASRAARALGQSDAALEYARRATEITRRGDAPALVVEAERALAEASSEVYLSARPVAAAQASANVGEALRARSAEAASVFRESERALEGLVGRTPEDPWVWQRLSTIYEADGRLADARDRTLRGLALRPDDEDLQQRLARIAFALGGSEALISDYAGLARAYPDVALVEWYPALTRFEEAVADLTAKRDARAGFRAAEAGLARCRALDPRYAEACRSYEALCRTGVGWCLFQAGDLEGARTSFFAAEDIARGGLAAEIPGRMPSAVIGLHHVGAAYNAEQTKSPNDLEAIENIQRAARIYDYLHEYQPTQANWANNAGLFNRDVAVALERKARALGAQGKVGEANQLLKRARELMEMSFRAYVDAALLAPEDVRIINDAGLILTYYLQRDVEAAEGYLTRAVELGERQVPILRSALEEPALSPEERDQRTNALEAVESALGDAYQNLGVLHLTMKGDPAVARGWLEKSAVTGPDPRDEITGPGGYLEQCAAALAGRLDPLVRPETRWAAPIESERKP